MPNLSKSHKALKMVRGRGSETQSFRSALAYLTRLEAELELVRSLLSDAWSDLEKSRDWKKFLRHSDAAQQRLHRAIKKLRRMK